MKSDFESINVHKIKITEKILAMTAIITSINAIIKIITTINTILTRLFRPKAYKLRP